MSEQTNITAFNFVHLMAVYRTIYIHIVQRLRIFFFQRLSLPILVRIIDPIRYKTISSVFDFLSRRPKRYIIYGKLVFQQILRYWNINSPKRRRTKKKHSKEYEGKNLPAGYHLRIFIRVFYDFEQAILRTSYQFPCAMLYIRILNAVDVLSNRTKTSRCKT